ncbi:helix-turn-helix transcriptional regulator [Candidatus Woesearchaeota archaeon]|nr:helix-turn-helix transcriptional regulator [Candidatus Woesearchaeota archaeon]
MKKRKKSVCGILDLYGFLGKKWAFALFSHIDDHPKTFNGLYSISKHLINPTLLSKRLKDMIELKMIKKELKNKKLVYTITPEGEELKGLLHKTKLWCISHHYKIPEKCKHIQCVCHDAFKK